MMVIALSFVGGILGSIIGVFIELHFDLEGRYEQWHYNRHVDHLRKAGLDGLERRAEEEPVYGYPTCKNEGF